MKIPYGMPDINSEDKKAVLKVFESQWLTGGKRTVEFENNFAQYVGVKYAIAVNSCTAALHLVMRSLGIGFGDEVIVPTLTFAATANAPIFCNAKPVFADVDKYSFNISPESILNHITKNTKVIIVVHYGGQPCDMDKILRIAEDHNLRVVEDCAHSLGATYKQKQTGSMGIAGCFSFYPTKPITTGEGGMITTNDESLAKKLRLLRNHGETTEALERINNWYYEVVDLGYNYRMTEMQAALGISQLNRCDVMRNERYEIAKHYSLMLSTSVKGIILPVVSQINANHLYVIRVIEQEYGISRNELYNKLSNMGIGLSVHYTPLHLMTYYRERYGYEKGDYPVAEMIYNEILSLPIYSKLLFEQVDYIVRGIIDLCV